MLSRDWRAWRVRYPARERISINELRTVVVEDSFLRFCENLLNSSNAFPILQVVSMFA